ncbi:hypothetical protein B0T10DRAFT_139126 [Thelonectria olida]|uniref:Uncharacterized protein n=1 Tax=Thelonectria olida TaxID=1576542 RepID=A0A9P9ANU7_9HYPO|nr:hypothetical protein B0T10DRAFT_139126 [Thelonectria olida]
MQVFGGIPVIHYPFLCGQDRSDVDLLNTRCYREGRRIPWETGITVVTPLNKHPAPVNATSIPFDRESAWCDAYTLSIRKGYGYSCTVCDGGGFCFCVECFDGGIRCRDSSHVLVPR